MEANQELVVSSQGIVGALSKKFWRAYEVNRSIRPDVEQAGMLALVKAAKVHDPAKTSWGSFASACAFRAMAREVSRLLNPIGGKRVKVVALGCDDGDDDDANFIRARSDDAVVCADEVAAALSCKLLTDRERLILRRTYGIDRPAVKDATIAREVGVGRSRVVQLRTAALAKIRLYRKYA